MTLNQFDPTLEPNRRIGAEMKRLMAAHPDWDQARLIDVACKNIEDQDKHTAAIYWQEVEEVRAEGRHPLWH
jgi:hypothetical protein